MAKKKDQDMEMHVDTTSDFDQELDNFFDDQSQFEDDATADNISAEQVDDEAQSDDEAPQMKQAQQGFVDKALEYAKKNWWFLAAGVVVVIIAIVLVSSLFSGPSHPQRHAVAQRAGFGIKPAVPEPVQVRPVEHKPATITPVTAVTLSQADLRNLLQGFAKLVNDNAEHLSQQIAALKAVEATTAKQEIAGEAVQQKEVEKGIVPLQSTLTTIAKQIDTNTKALTKVSAALVKTQRQLALLVAEKAADQTHLTLRAIVPGRAWLVNNAGQTITVAVGDSIPNYGTVSKIDSDAGKVYMSSGYVFQ